MASRTLLVAALLGLAAAIAPAAAASRQASGEPQAGDLLWTFAEEDPFFDQRVRLALILLMDLEDAPLFPASPDDREFIAMPGISADAELLLLAAGIDIARIEVIGECRVWAAPPPVEGSTVGVEQRGLAALAIGAALSELLESRGAPIGVCALTSDPATAQIFVWAFGETAPANPQRPAGTLLGQATLEGRPPGAGTGGGGGGLAVPSTGNAGLTEPRDTEAADVLLLLALAVALPLAVRSATRRASR